MKHLETALLQERKARESAERKARALSGNGNLDVEEEQSSNVEGYEPPLDSLELIEKDLPNGLKNTASGSSSAQHTPVPSIGAFNHSLEHPNNSTDPSTVQTRYELLKQEFDQMKQIMETYKRRAEEAETSQRRFADLIESIGAGRPDATTSSGPSSVKSFDSTLIGSDAPSDDTAVSSTSGDPTMNHSIEKAGFLDTTSNKQQSHSTTTNLLNGNAIAPASGTLTSPAELEKSLMRQLRATASAAMDARDGNGSLAQERWNQSAPYVSMVGVVLIGFGIMTWLNGWQPPVGGGSKLND